MPVAPMPVNDVLIYEDVLVIDVKNIDFRIKNIKNMFFSLL